MYKISNLKGSNSGSGVRDLKFLKAAILVQVYEISNFKGSSYSSGVRDLEF